MSVNLKDRELREKERKIAARVRFLTKVTVFVESIARELGDTNNGGRIYKLFNFNNFSFSVNTGQLDGRGKVFQVWYHPTGKCSYDLVPVLEMYLQSEIKDCILNEFDPLREWQDELLRVIRCRKSLTARFKRTVTARKKSSKSKSQYRLELEEMAMRLKVLT